MLDELNNKIETPILTLWSKKTHKIKVNICSAMELTMALKLYSNG
jgi:hypothetical protein